ncbi:hypothetical protein LSAT2_028564, partial [Lamellibrachia satsuma]
LRDGETPYTADKRPTDDSGRTSADRGLSTGSWATTNTVGPVSPRLPLTSARFHLISSSTGSLCEFLQRRVDRMFHAGTPELALTILGLVSGESPLTQIHHLAARQTGSRPRNKMPRCSQNLLWRPCSLSTRDIY